MFDGDIGQTVGLDDDAQLNYSYHRYSRGGNELRAFDQMFREFSESEVFVGGGLGQGAATALDTGKPGGVSNRDNLPPKGSLADLTNSVIPENEPPPPKEPPARVKGLEPDGDGGTMQGRESP